MMRKHARTLTYNANRGKISSEDLELMALITCSECGKSYSDKAEACPSCGCPTSLQTQVSSLTREETTSTQDTATSLSTKNTVSSANNDKLKIGGIIAIGVGAVIALSSGLITGSEKESYRVGNTWQTDISRSDGEQLAANGFLALGILGAAGGAVFLMTGMGVISKDLWTEMTGQSTNSGVDVPKEKRDLYRDLIHLVYQDLSLSGTPSLYTSELNDEEFIIKTHSGKRICSFVKTSKSSSASLDSWELKK